MNGKNDVANRRGHPYLKYVQHTAQSGKRRIGIRLNALNLFRLVCLMTLFQFTTMSIPTTRMKQSVLVSLQSKPMEVSPLTKGAKFGLLKALKS